MIVKKILFNLQNLAKNHFFIFKKLYDFLMSFFTYLSKSLTKNYLKWKNDHNLKKANSKIQFKYEFL